jgi:hypothetical protein
MHAACLTGSQHRAHVQHIIGCCVYTAELSVAGRGYLASIKFKVPLPIPCAVQLGGRCAQVNSYRVAAKQLITGWWAVFLQKM